MNWLRDIYTQHKGMVWGAGLGLLLAILVMSINIWRTLLLIIFIGAGVLIGSRFDRGNQSNDDFFSRFFKR